MKLINTIAFLILLSCNTKRHDVPSTSDQRIDTADTFSNIKSCMPSDTSIETAGVKYINRDSFFQVQVWIDKYNTILPYSFDCSMPAGLVPELYSASKDIICFLRGSGQDYRVFVICHLEKDKIVYKEYETAMFTDLKNGRVVYQEYNNPSIIYVEDIKTGKRKTFHITSETIYSHFHDGRIEGNKLILFYGNSKITFPLN